MSKFIDTNSPFDIQFNQMYTGGKGFHLLQLARNGFQVPEFIIYNATETSIKTPLNPDEIQLIKESLGFPHRVSIRSSALGEDGFSHSFAGQFLTELNVSWETLNDSIERVWNSLNRTEIETYCKEHGINVPNKMSIIIQTMLQPDFSGVAFGVNPVNGHRNEMIITAAPGLGEALVSGAVNGDTFVVKDDSVECISGEAASPETLSTEQVVAVGEQLKRLKKLYGKPQDIEFSWVKNELFLLQTRPVTSLDKLADTGAEMILWDNSNIIESYPGVTTPLTFSFIIKMYESVYLQLCRLLGVSEKDLRENAAVFSNMLGLIEGRVYYNLLSWYKALALLPGYHLNAEFMEKMMGVKERFELKNRPQRSKLIERLRVLVMVKSMISNLRALPKMRINFQSDFQKELDRFNAIALDKKNVVELMELMIDFQSTLLKKWKAPLVNDFYAMIYFGLLQKTAEKYGLPPGIHNDLLCGASDIISTEPIKRMKEISSAIVQFHTLENAFLIESPEQILRLINEPNYEPVQKLFDTYLNQFGDRTVGELKLETITYKQEPTALIQLIQSYIRQGFGHSENVNERVDLKMRKNAEEKVGHILKGKPFKKWFFHYLLKRTRILVSARENLRFERTRGFGKVREIFLAIGNQFFSEGILEHPRDIFYLTQEEIFDFIKGTSVTPEISELVSFRKEKFAKYETTTTSERIRTYGAVYHGNSFSQEKSTSLDGEDLKGIGCCPGIVKAKVRIVLDPKEVSDLNGDILVTASTDPGWVTLFPTASAIIVERGSLLSHSAIVSRELGKPCIVGVTHLLSKIKTGDWVEMDGSTGQIKIIK